MTGQPPKRPIYVRAIEAALRRPMGNREPRGRLPDRLEPYGPQLPLAELVVEVNQLYHRAEAGAYDQSHPEIREQLPPIWSEMIRQAIGCSGRGPWRVLDFGCGTGFESEQLLQGLAPENIAELVCYDPSQEMIEFCRRRVAPRFPAARFCSRLDDALAGGCRFNLLATNSVLHHLPDPLGTIKGLLPSMVPNAVWLAGHEPSQRFYNNADCVALYEQFRRHQRWVKFFSIGKYVSALRLLWKAHPARQSARAAVEAGLFRREPPMSLISELVDYHVVRTGARAKEGQGLDCRIMQADLAGTWKLVWVTTYSFMGLAYEGHLRGKWARGAAELRRRYPDDGANFCCVWRRSACP